MHQYEKRKNEREGKQRRKAKEEEDRKNRRDAHS
jgi:hypothetical protein